MNEFVRTLIKLILGRLPNQTFAAEVLDVDTTAFTCTVKPVDGGAKLENVRLKASIDNNANAIVLLPKKKSKVICSILDNNENIAIVVGVDEIQGWKMKMGDGFKCELDQNGNLVYNDGVNKGLAKVDAIANKLNTLEQDLNSIKTVFAGWTPTPNDGGAALKAASAAWSAQQFQQTAGEDLHNPKIKH
jgi:hypothetical protein